MPKGISGFAGLVSPLYFVALQQSRQSLTILEQRDLNISEEYLGAVQAFLGVTNCNDDNKSNLFGQLEPLQTAMNERFQKFCPITQENESQICTVLMELNTWRFPNYCRYKLSKAELFTFFTPCGNIPQTGRQHVHIYYYWNGLRLGQIHQTIQQLIDHYLHLQSHRSWWVVHLFSFLVTPFGYGLDWRTIFSTTKAIWKERGQKESWHCAGKHWTK